MKNYIHKSRYFYGQEVSPYGLEHGYIDYRTLARCFDAVLNNEIIPKTVNAGYYWETVNGSDIRYYDTQKEKYISESDIDDWNNIEEEYEDIYQYFIIDEAGANILQELTDEILFYNEDLDMYVWGVTHYGTSWDYVLTDIKIDLSKSEAV